MSPADPPSSSSPEDHPAADAEAAECAVCMTETAHRLQPCAHAVCAECAHRWFAQGVHSCPLCIQPVVGLHTTLASDPLPRVDDASGRRVSLDFPTGTHAGVTLANVGDARGVRVQRVLAADRGHACGLRAGDVITHLNGLVVKDHADAAGMFTRAADAGVLLHCTVRRPASRLAAWLLSVF